MLNASHEGVDLQRPVRVAPGAVRWTSQTVGVVAVAGDVAIICASAWIAYLIRFRELDMPANYIYPVALAAILSANVFRWRRLYDLETYDRRARHLLNLVAAQLLVALVLVGIGFGLKTSADFSRLWLGTWMLVSSFGVSAWFYARSLVVRSAQARGLLHDRLLIVGEPERIASFSNWLVRRAPRRLSVLGIVSISCPSPDDMVRAGQVRDLQRLAEELVPDRVVLLFNWREPEIIQQCVRTLRSLALDVELLLPRVGEEWVGRPVTHLGGLLAMNLMRSPLSQEARLVKLLEDYILAGLILLLVSPVMLVAALLVKLSSPGPVFYRQRRSGFQKLEFRIYKFRTMTIQPEGAFRQATKGDSRITPIGRFLRATSIDELPQLLNVLRGEMSLVGPRPHEVSMNADFALQIDDYLVRHRIKPGITGWAQVNGARGETRTLQDMERRLTYDLAYVDNWSFWLDLQILLRTAGVFFFHKNAY